MPDENTNPTGTSPIPQDNQSTANQQGDDFVLDFGGEENNENDVKPDVKIDDLEDAKTQEENSTNEDFNSNLFDDNENTEPSENNNEIKDENVDNEESDDDFNISLDDNDEETGDEETEDEETEDEETGDEETEDEETEDEETEDEEIKDEETEDEETEDEEIKDEETGDEETGDEETGDEETGDEEIKDEEIKDEETEDEETEDEETEDEETEDEETEDEETEDEETEDEETEDEGIKDEETGDNDFNIVLDEKTSEDSQGTDNDVLLPDNNENIGETNPDDKINVDVDGLVPSQEETDNISSDLEESSNDNPKPLEQDSTNITTTGELLNQPELGDLLGNSSNDFLIQEPENTSTVMEDNEDGNIEQEQNPLQGNMNFIPEDNEDGNIEQEKNPLQGNMNFTPENDEDGNIGQEQNLLEGNTNFIPEDNEDGNIGQEQNLLQENTNFVPENEEDGNIGQEQNLLEENTNFVPENNEENNMMDMSKNLPDENTENQSFTLDYTNSNELENNTNQTSNENIDGINNGEITSEPGETNINIDTNQIENTNQVESQQISTLSLDQILDTELNSDPKFSDDSKAVPINVSTNKGFFDKKTLGIVAGIGLFVLAGVVVVTFSSKSLGKNTGTTTDGNQYVEEYVDDHQVANTEESEEDTNLGENLEEDIQGDISTPESNVTVDFPDPDWDDNGGDYEFGDIEPYVSDEYDYYNEENVSQSDEVEISDVLLVISNYKSQAEVYYSQGDDMQDKKLIRYSLQAIHLCENYKEQIENEESLDEEGFSLFKSKVEKILNKAEEYLGGDSYNEFSQNNDYYEF